MPCPEKRERKTAQGERGKRRGKRERKRSYGKKERAEGALETEKGSGRAADPVASRQARGARVETASEPETQAPCSLM